MIEPEADARPHRADAARVRRARSRSRTGPTGRHIRLAGGQRLIGAHVRVPGDPSSAAFPLVAALITPGSEVTVEGVLLNPAAHRPLRHPAEMGADLTIANAREEGGERVGDVTAALLAAERRRRAARARALDDRRISDPGRRGGLRRGPDRHARHRRAAGQGERPHRPDGGRASRACGVGVEEEPEGLIVRRRRRAPTTASRGGGLRAHPRRPPHRHELPGPGPGRRARRSTVDEPGMIATSFPGFAELMARPGRGDRGGVTRLRHRRRRAGGVRQGDHRRAPGRRLRPAGAGHRPALPGGGRRAGARRRRPRRRGRGRAARARRSISPGWTIRPCARARPARRPAGSRSTRRCARPCATSSAPSPRQPGGAVLDGRDIGTVIAPDAPAKLFVTASRRGARAGAAGCSCRPPIRAVDLRGRSWPTSARRDARDAARADSPMRPAPDAVLLDTTEMTIDARRRCGPPHRRGGARPVGSYPAG